MVRDKEIERLIHYAKGLGVKVTIYNKSHPHDSGSWAIDGSQIEIYAGKKVSKTDVIITLVHEIAHQVWFIHEKERQPDLKFEEAITREYHTGDPLPTPKHLRKRIYDVERDSTQWWDAIIKDTDIKIPQWKFDLHKEYDVWMYERYYEDGSFPRGKKRSEKWNELNAKWNPRG